MRPSDSSTFKLALHAKLLLNQSYCQSAGDAADSGRGQREPRVVMLEQRVAEPVDPPRQRGIGLIVPLDFRLDRELWRWAPENVSLHLTRLPIAARGITVGRAKALADPGAVEQATRDLLAPGPEVVAYTCAAGSFVNGGAGEGVLREAMLTAGAPAACTTSGALVEELRRLGLRRLALVTPFGDALTRKLVGFLADNQVQAVTTTRLAEATEPQRVRDHEDADAVFVCCTNVPTYDLIDPLAEAFGKPVLTANEVLMHAALRALGAPAVSPRAPSLR
jgi:maleate isomerase